MQKIKYYFAIIILFSFTFSQRTAKPVIYGKHWVAITGNLLVLRLEQQYSQKEAMQLMLLVQC